MMTLGKLTYRQLQRILPHLSDSQLDCDLTCEFEEGHAYPLGFGITEGESGLDDDHPVFIDNSESCDEPKRATEHQVELFIWSLQQSKE